MHTTQILLTLPILAGALSALPQSDPEPFADHRAGVETGELVYALDGGPERVRKVRFMHDATAGTFRLGEPRTVASVPATDGLMFTPDQHLLLGSGSSMAHKVDPQTGMVETREVAGTKVHRVMLDPDGQRVWGAGDRGFLAEFPLWPFAKGTAHALTGDDRHLLQLAWVGEEVYYVARGEEGAGSFGRIDLRTFETTRLLSHIAATRGIVLDPHTGHLLLFGKHAMFQVDPAHPSRVLAHRSFEGHPVLVGATLAGGSADGHGRIFATATSGHVVFLDIASSRRVDHPDFERIEFLEPGLGHIAPLSGPGSPCDPRARVVSYGDGWAGTLGVPSLSAPLPPVEGGPYPIQIGNSRGTATKGCLMISTQRGSEATRYGGELLIDTQSMMSTVALSSIPAAGLQHTLNAPLLTAQSCRMAIYLQVIEIDPGASRGISFTPGLEVVLGAQ